MFESSSFGQSIESYIKMIQLILTAIFPHLLLCIFNHSDLLSLKLMISHVTLLGNIGTSTRIA